VSATEGSFKLEQLEAVAPDQTWRNRDGVFYNQFHTLVRIGNPTDKPLSVTKVESKVMSKDSGLDDAAETLLGYKRGFYNYSYEVGPYNVEFDANSNRIFAIRTSVAIKADGQIERHRRVHSSLPAPLMIQITVTDDAGKSVMLEVEAGHEERQLDTKASAEAYDKKNFKEFVVCDDASLEERIWLAVDEVREASQEPRLELKHQGRQSIYIYATTLEKAVWDATKSKNPVQPIDWKFSGVDDKVSVQAFALIDLATRYAYGLRFELKTTTSSTVVERPIPNLYA